MKITSKPLNAIVGTLMASSVALMGAATVNADVNPFGATELQGGYMQIAGKGEGSCGEGKCGAKKGKEGSCGVDKSGSDQAKGNEGSCGGKNKTKVKGKEGSCGEGKCGGKKA